VHSVASYAVRRVCIVTRSTPVGVSGIIGERFKTTAAVSAAAVPFLIRVC